MAMNPRVSIRAAGNGYIVECLNREFACATIDQGFHIIRHLLGEPIYRDVGSDYAHEGSGSLRVREEMKG